MEQDANLSPVTSSTSTVEAAPRIVVWHRTILALCFGVFAVEVGLCLVVFPWLASWDFNYVPLRMPGLRPIWLSAWVRGAISGLGFVNIYVGLAEVFGRLRALLAKRHAKMGQEQA